MALDQSAIASLLEYLRGSPEIPIDATVAERLARIAVDAGFVTSNLEFLQRIQASPISTLILFLGFVGSSGGSGDLIAFTMDTVGNITFSDDLSSWNLYEVTGPEPSLIGPAASVAHDVSTETILAKTLADATAFWDGEGDLSASVFDLNFGAGKYTIALFMPSAGVGSANQINFASTLGAPEGAPESVDSFVVRAESLETLENPSIQVVWA